MKQFLLEKVKFSKGQYERLTKEYLEKKNKDGILDILSKTENPQYLYWTDLKYKNWIPAKYNYNKEDFWKLVKTHRRINNKKVNGIYNTNKKPFYFLELDRFDKFLAELDKISKGNFSSINNEMKEELIKNNLIEESIASSQLEGANTTRKVAKEMINSGRKPKNNSERMIMNNYNAMKILEEDYKNKELTLKTIFNLHKILTKDDTSIPEDKRGAFRVDEDAIVVGARNSSNEYAHEAPKIDFVKKQIKKLTDFANDKTEDEYEFIHPLIKAIIIHFWIGYLHPFVDGNGRLARCLFYWYMLRHNYDVIGYYPISLRLKESPKQYSLAYIYTEQDDNDLTYFIDYNIRKIEESQIGFLDYFNKKIEISKYINKITIKHKLSNRIQKMLQHINSSGKNYITPTIYQELFDISKPTAIGDLKELKNLKILKEQKSGREMRYFINTGSMNK
ncbi:Fic family protein [Pseudomonadota bacterium]